MIAIGLTLFVIGRIGLHIFPPVRPIVRGKVSAGTFIASVAVLLGLLLIFIGIVKFAWNYLP